MCRRVLEHLTHCDELPHDLASSLVTIHMPLIESSFRQDFPEDFLPAECRWQTGRTRI